MTLQERFRALITELKHPDETQGYNDLIARLRIDFPLQGECSTGHEGETSGQRSQYLWMENGAYLRADAHCDRIGQEPTHTASICLCSMDNPQGIALYTETKNGLGNVSRQGVADDVVERLEAVVERLEEMSPAQMTLDTALQYFSTPTASVSAYQSLSEQLQADPEVVRAALQLFYQECQGICAARQMDGAGMTEEQTLLQEGDEASLFLDRVQGEAYLLGLNRHFTPEQMNRLTVEAIVQEGRQDALTDLSARYEKTQRMLENGPRIRKELAMREERERLLQRAAEQQLLLETGREKLRHIEENIREVGERTYNVFQRFFRRDWVKDQQYRDASDRNNWEVSRGFTQEEIDRWNQSVQETENRLGPVSRQITSVSGQYQNTEDFDRRMERGSQFLASVSPLYWAYQTFVKDQNQTQAQTQEQDQVITETETETTYAQVQTGIQVVG